MADDLGVLYTDRQLRDVERTISRLYTQAQKDIEQKMSDFSDRMAKREKLYEARVAAGTMTQDEFDHWKSSVVFRGKQWDDKMAQVSEVLANTNTVANNVVRRNQIGVFAMNGNYAGYELEHGAGVSFGFDLYDQTTVSRLLRDKPNILPFKKLDKEKDMKWNFKNIRSQVTQGILQGESIPKIAKRLAEAVPNRNEKQMVLHARTAMTAAQNGGRMERYKEAEDLGIKFKKVWLATLDGRTRDTHADLDGQAVKPDEDFEVDGYKISYPGDPHAAPEMVYNCRCTLTTELEDYPHSFNRRETSSGEVIEDMSYREWERSKQHNGEYKPSKSYYRDLSEFGYDEETTKILNNRFIELDSKYGAEISEITTTLKDAQEDYDLYYENYVNKLLQDNPRMRKSTAERRAVEVLGARPDGSSVDFALTGGNFNMNTKRMTLNPDGVVSAVSLDKDIEHRRRYLERMEKRKARGAEVYPAGNAVISVEGSFIHEYGHALDAEFNIRENPQFREFLSGLTVEDIRLQVSDYATSNNMEFIAECFAQSYLGEYQSEISKGFMKVLEGIIRDRAK